MKKLFHVMIAGVLVLSITGCGKSETSRTRNGGLMSTEGAGTGFVSGVASGLLGRGLALIPPIPGIPPQIADLLGLQGGEDKNAAVLAAIAAIEAHLVQIDIKLVQISQQIETVQGGINDLIGLVNFVIKQQKCQAADAKYAQLLPLTIVIEETWERLYGTSTNPGLIKAIMDQMKTDVNNNVNNPEFTFTAAQMNGLDEEKDLIRDQIKFAVQTLGAVLLSSPNSPGLIVWAQDCAKNRFMSSYDSSLNSAIVQGFQILLEKAATLQVWAKAYNNQYLSAKDLNFIVSKYDTIYRKLDMMDAMQIPRGQVLDTLTNKMWTRGEDNIRLVQAMNGCPHASVDNTRRTMSGLGIVVREPLSCYTSTAIDTPMTDRTQWRLPAIYELSQPDIASQKVLWKGLGGFPSAGDALFSSWNGKTCGSTGLGECATPAAYLQANGAGQLLSSTTLNEVRATARQAARSANGLVWSSTSMAAASGGLPYPRATASNANILQENDRSLGVSRTPKKVTVEKLNCGHYYKRWCGGGQNPHAGVFLGKLWDFETSHTYDMGDGTAEIFLRRQGFTMYGTDNQQSLPHEAAFMNGDTKSNRYAAFNGRSCNSLYPNPAELRVEGGTYRSTCVDWRDGGVSDLCRGGLTTTDLVPRGAFTYGDVPFPHTVASVRTADLLAQALNNEQVHAIASNTEWGGSFDCTAKKDTTSNNRAAQDWDCCEYTQLYSSASFPEYGKTLYVRDLLQTELYPSEFYTFNDFATGGFGKSSRQITEAVLPPTMSVLSFNGEVAVRSADITDGETRCLITSGVHTVPTNWSMLDQPGCGTGEKLNSLKPGTHIVYAMGKYARSSAAGIDQFTGMAIREIKFEGTKPKKAEFTVTPQNGSIMARLTPPRNPAYRYEATASDGTTTKMCALTTTLTTTACTITGLANNVLTEVTIKTLWGTQFSDSDALGTTPFGPPPDFTCVTVLAEDKNVTLNCSSPTNDTVGVQTPVAQYVVKKDSTVLSECLPATNCVINGLENGENTNLEVAATNDFGRTRDVITVRSIGKPASPTEVVVSGSNGEITVSWTRESTGDPAAKYVATATNGSTSYSCISKQPMNDGIMTSSAPTGCVITVPRTNSNLSYTVAVRGGNGNCSDSSTTCNYSVAAQATATVKPQFSPDRPTLRADVENSKITVTATPGTQYAQSTNKITIESDPTGLSCDASSTNQWKCVFDTFTEGQSYTFTGTGYNDNSVAGEPGTSNAITRHATPAAPSLSETQVDDTKIYVKIESSTDVIDSYTVTATPGGRTCLISTPNQSCEVTGLTNGEAYSVSATAQNNGGVSASSALVPNLRPFGKPLPGSAPRVTLDTRAGSAVFRVAVSQPRGVDITKYLVEMVNVDKECEIVFPGTTCDIQIGENNRNFDYQFTFKSYNRIGWSLPSERSRIVVYEDAPLAPQDVVLDADFVGNITVRVLPNAEGSRPTKFAVNFSGERSYPCAPAANGECVIDKAARGKEYNVTMTAINASGTSPETRRRYFLPGPPENPVVARSVVSVGGIVNELVAGKPLANTTSVLVTATPSLGGDPLSCKIILPAETCAIKTDPTKTYNISTVGVGASGEKTSVIKSPKPTDVVKRIVIGTKNFVAPVGTQNLVAPLGIKLPPAKTAVPQINKTINLGKKATSKIKIDTVYSDFIKSLPLSAGKVSLLKFSGKVKSDSKKICKIKGSDVILLKKGVCNISAKFKVIENKKSETVEQTAKITVR